MTATNRYWLLEKRPVGDRYADALSFQTESAPEPGEGQALVRTIYLSLDPANRGWMGEGASYRPPVKLGGPMEGLILGQVVKSRSPALAEGDLVWGLGHWAEYAVLPAKMLNKLPAGTGLPLTAFATVLGMTGATAYFGLLEIGKPKAGETVVVSAAAGAVGSLVGQIAKIKECRAVGIAGGAEKCRWLTEELGFDAAIDYKAGNLSARLKEHCPDGVDIYFENVGGAITDAVFRHLNMHARVPLCGLISQYNATELPPGPNLGPILMRRGLIQGFIVTDFMDRTPEMVRDMGAWLAAGRLKYKVDVVDGIENTVTAFGRLFTGANVGKLLVRVGPEAG